MRYRVLKFFTTAVNFAFIWLLFHLFFGGLDLPFVTGCLIISGFWLGFTWMRLNRLFQTYVSALARVQIFLPLAAGTVLDLLALWHNGEPRFSALAVVELAGWLAVFFRWRSCVQRFQREGHGPLPKNAWINPTDLRPGDILLVTGNMANVAHDAVGHGELVIKRPSDGKLICFSTWMKFGVVINPIERITKGSEKKGFYIAVRPVVPWTEEENARAYEIATGMRAENRAWAKEENARREAFIKRLPLPSFLKARLLKLFFVDGYDWRGLIIGVPRKHAWTCIAACLEVFVRLGRKMQPYGTGLFGMGTGLLDPIVPVRFVYDPNFHLLDLDDEARSKQGVPN